MKSAGGCQESHRGSPATSLDNRPTLTQGSAQLVYITRVKTDPFDTTVNMNDLIAMSSGQLA